MDKPDREIAEEWRTIKGYEGLYEVSNLGRVKSLSRTMPHKNFGTWNIRERILKQNWGGPTDSQYLYVFLHKGHGNQRLFRVHRLVAEAFLPKIEGRNVVNHKDCDRSNNAASNLEWCTDLENTRHAFANGRCSNVGKYQMRAVVNVDTGERFTSIDEACKRYGVTHRAIYQVANGKGTTCCGFHWQYADEHDKGFPPRKTSNYNYSSVEQLDADNKSIIAVFQSVKAASQQTGVCRQSITACCVGRYHTAGGYGWRYKIDG